VFELREKTFYERMNALIERRLFDWAVEICIQQNALEEYVMVRELLVNCFPRSMPVYLFFH
jgi:hypothetical protein